MTKITGTRNNIQCIFFAFLLCIFTTASQTDAFAFKDKTMINLNLSIWQIISDTQEQTSLSLKSTEKILGQNLIEETEQSNEYFQKYTGKQINLAQDVVISSINLRLPRNPSGNPGLLVLDIQGECIRLSQVQQVFPNLVITESPRGRSLEDATTHTSGSEWGQVSFGFKEKNPDCLSYVVLKANK